MSAVQVEPCGRRKSPDHPVPVSAVTPVWGKHCSSCAKGLWDSATKWLFRSEMFVVFIIVCSFEMMGSAPWQRMLLYVNATHSPHVHRHRGHKRSGVSPTCKAQICIPAGRVARLRVCAWVEMLCLFLPVRMSSVYAMNKIALSLCAPANIVVRAWAIFFLKRLGQSLTWSAVCSQTEQDFSLLLAGLL